MLLKMVSTTVFLSLAITSVEAFGQSSTDKSDSIAHSRSEPPLNETDAAHEPSHDQRMAWWREARFGMFIHWGLYSIPAGVWNGKPVPRTAEWIMNNASLTVEDYEPLAKQFNPVKFDARSWARLAKQAGMKYVVITAKHHDGFCLFDSKYTTYDVMDATPFGRDIIREVVEAFRGEGLRVGIYYSIMDWHHPDYLPRRKIDRRPVDNANFERYVEYCKAQVKELLTNYGPIDVIWFDGEWNDTWTHRHGLEMYDYIHSHWPHTLVNNRVDKGRQDKSSKREKHYAGDFGTPEQEIPPNGLPGVDWETCMTMNDTWGFGQNDHHWKSAKTLVETLVDCASKGGNFLLNVGPRSDGTIPPASVERLEQIGRWMAGHGESIYGTSATPFANPLPWGRCTAKKNKLYLHVFQWPASGQLQTPALKKRVLRAHLLGEDSASSLQVAATAKKTVVTLPKAKPNSILPVVVLDMDRTPTR